MSYIVGLDPSLANLGIVVLDEAGGLQGSTVIKSESAGTEIAARIDRYHRHAHNALKFIAGYPDVQLIAIEGYSFNSPGRGNDLAEFGGILRTHLLAKYRVVESSPTQVKKFALGKGVGDKALIMAHVVDRWKWMPPSEHEADAYVLARIGLGVCGFVTPATLPQREVVTEVLAGPKPKKRKSRKKDAA